jgi:TRAP-type C4-dicarboxylate transport system substrate-binding protein
MREMVKLGAAIAALTAALAVGACGGGVRQRAGGKPTGRTTVLRLANANGGIGDLQLFIDQVAKLSGGRLRIEAVNGWRKGQTEYEKGLIQDVRAGKADLGWVGSRVLASVGVRSFEPLHAPFFIDSYELERKALDSNTVARMLRDLERIGLSGIAVLPGGLEYLQLDRKIKDPADIAGLRIGYYDSPLHKAALAALGARPTAIPTSESVRGLDGFAAGVGSVYGNGYNNTAKYTVADTPLWPRPLVVFANKQKWASLPQADRDLITQAARQARVSMLAALPKSEQTAMMHLCNIGDRLVNIGDAAQARMQEAVLPLFAKLRNDPATTDAMAEIEALRTGSPHHVRCPASASASTQQSALTGVFEATERKTDTGASASGDFADAEADAIKMRLELSGGRAVITDYLPDGPSPGYDEPYSIFKDIIKFEARDNPFTARWKLDGNKLRFTDISGPPGDQFVWGRTWIKTG